MNDRSNSTNSQQGASFSKFNVTGGNSSNFNIGNTTQNVYQQDKSEFYEIELEQYKPPNFKSPQITSSLAEVLSQNKFLVLGGSHDVKKSDLAKHLAWYLSDRESNSTFQKLTAKEWVRSSDPQSIDIELQKTKESTIFILTDIAPHHLVGHNLSRVQEVVASSLHYVIITTNTPSSAWKLPGKTKSFWCDLSVDSIADAENLISKFTTEESLRECFYHSKKPREQLLILGLSFFDGLFDDQFFAAIETLVEATWKQRDSSLRALDYCDLDNLGDLFSFTKMTTEFMLVQFDVPGRRQMLFKIAWESYRRQILAALPVLVSLVKNSVTHFERELYGSSVRCNQIRRTISEAISDIGLISSDAVEDSLLTIAADKDINVQAVAAKAMARWRDDEAKAFIVNENENLNVDQRLFGTLQRWQHEARIMSLVDAALKKQNYEESQKPQDYIRATIALTVGEAALYDPPDELAPELCSLLEDLINDQNSLVRERVFKDTLPRIIPLHLIQLRPILKSFLHKVDGLIQVVASALAFSYQFRPKDVLATLDLWKTTCEKNSSKGVDTSKVGSREALLATVALTYGEIECDERSILITIQQVIDYLQNILLEEVHPLVREAALFAIGRQVERIFKQIKAKPEDLSSDPLYRIVTHQLPELVAKLTRRECQKFVDKLTEVYLDQRAILRNGEEPKFIEVGKRQYPVWLNSPRPSTVVENVMLNWAKNDGNITAQQVATHASANFVSKLDQEEERQIRRLRQARTPSVIELQPIYVTPIVGRPIPQDWYFGKLIPRLATRNANNYEKTIRNLLPEGLRQHLLSRDAMNFLLRKWGSSLDKDVKTISERLKSGLWLAENLGWILALGIGGVLTLVGASAISLSKSFEADIAEPPVAPSTAPVQSSVSPTLTHASISKQEALAVINSYLQEKPRMFAPPFERQLTGKFLMGKAYKDTVDAIDWLQQNGAYYRFEKTSLAEGLSYFSSMNDQVELDVKITEQYFYHENNKSPNLVNSSTDYRFVLQQENGAWKIANRVGK